VRKNDEKNSYVVVYFKENWRSAEHKQNELRRSIHGNKQEREKNETERSIT